MIQIHPTYNTEVSIQEAVEHFNNRKEILIVCSTEKEGIYFCQMLVKSIVSLSVLNEFPFEYLADAKFYVKGD